MKKILSREIFEYFDWAMFGCVLVIVAIGFLNLYSATYNLPIARYVRSQGMWVVMGFLVALILTFFDYRILERFAYPFYGLVVILLAVVLFWGKASLGAQRWIQLGPFSLQPSELAKPAIALVLARYFFSRHRTESLDFKGLFWPFVLTAVPFVLILTQPDLGTSLVVVAVAASMLLFIGVRPRVLITFALIGMVTAPVAWKYVLRPYQKERIYTFLNPERNPLDQGYQIIQSKIAIGSGELVGKGFLEGTQSKLQFLPKQHTDFVFSNFAEEFGFFGSMVLLALYASFALLGINIAFLAKERFGMMLALGLTAMITAQAVINLGMEMGLLPVVGVPLPLFSYGGTSMLTSLLAVGVLLNISQRRYMF